MTRHHHDSSGLSRYGFLDDPAGRVRRGRRIATALAALGGLDLARCRVLDVGCSAGTITRTLAAEAAMTVGTDVDLDALLYAAANSTASEALVFAAATGEALPFADGIFDAAVCNHVYEHARDAQALMREISRVLRPGGLCYFAGGHMLQLVEPHYRLPLLSWLPREWAHRYLRWAGRGERYDERFIMPWRMPELFTEFSRASFVSPAMLQAWRLFDLAPRSWPSGWGERLPRSLAFAAACVAPTYIWLLEK